MEDLKFDDSMILTSESVTGTVTRKIVSIFNIKLYNSMPEHSDLDVALKSRVM
jgi:hypothetical protein